MAAYRFIKGVMGLAILMYCVLMTVQPVGAVDDPFYPDYAEIQALLQNLAADYSSIAAYHEIGSETHGSRRIFAIKISDNVDNEEDEPAWIFTGVIHGSEQLGMRPLIDLALELTDQYGSDAAITNWVDAYEIWFVMVLNPWGFDHEKFGAGSSTGTRKNGIDTGNATTAGVDLARNYDFRWANGGSTDTSDYDFRGPSAFSENETQAIRDLFLQQRPVFGITFHQGNNPDGGQIMRPWSDAPPDAALLADYAQLYADWVFTSRSGGGFCDGTLQDPNGQAGCTNPEPAGIEYCADLCWEMDQATLGACGQPSNWYYSAAGTFEYTVEVSDRKFNGSFMHTTSGPGDSDEQTAKEIATEFARNHQDAIKSWFDQFLYTSTAPYQYTGPGLTGHITDALLGTALSATIEVAGYTGTYIDDRISDATFGRYWRLLPAGTHTVTVSKPGYTTWSTTVTVGGGALTQLDVALMPELQIHRPSDSFVAWVGQPSSARTFTVRLHLGSAGDPCIGPLPFSVFVKDESSTWIEAHTGAQACVQDTYWLSVQAPDDSDGIFAVDGIYDLRVELDTVAGESAASIRYTDREEDVIIVMDVSGSMINGGKMEAAQEAASLLTNELADNDQGALVWFTGDSVEPNKDAYTDFELAPMNIGNQVALIGKIAALTPQDRTSIGDGLDEALDESESVHADPDHYCGIVLLSDGLENEALFWANVQSRAETSGCIFHVVALGPESDEVLLQQISRKGTLATDDDGSYEYATITDGAAALAAAMTPRWPNRLAARYNDIAACMAQRQHFFKVFDAVGAVPTNHAILVDDTLDPIVITLKWSGVRSIGELELVDPEGNFVDPASGGVIYRSGSYHEVYRISKPVPGLWTARVINKKPQDEYLSYLLTANGDTPIEFQIFTGADIHPVVQGEKVPILGLLTKGGQPVPGADVRAYIEAPDGSKSQLLLYDDGLHNDGAAGDGFYANLYDRIIQGDFVKPSVPEGQEIAVVGSYSVEGIAVTPSFKRIARSGFAVEPSVDEDGDGIPSNWEKRHGLDEKNAKDAQLDPDMDDLSNIGEFKAGTDPQDSDTDDGGESDGSEVNAALDPLWPKDDTIAPMADIHISALPNGARLTWQPDASHKKHRIRRRELPDGVWYVIADGVSPTGTYDDANLTNGTRYAYLMCAQGQSGQWSGYSAMVTVIPVEDPFAPQGSVVINKDDEHTAFRKVALNFKASSDTVQMRFASRVDEGTDEIGSQWSTFSEEIVWRIPAHVRPGGTCTIFAQFRDKAGHISAIAMDSILYLPDLEPCEGDLDDSGRVNATDIDLFVDHFGLASCAGCAADTDSDLDVDGTDLKKLIDDLWRTECP